jgi:hypothetical protein
VKIIVSRPVLNRHRMLYLYSVLLLQCVCTLSHVVNRCVDYHAVNTLATSGVPCLLRRIWPQTAVSWLPRALPRSITKDHLLLAVPPPLPAVYISENDRVALSGFVDLKRRIPICWFLLTICTSNSKTFVPPNLLWCSKIYYLCDKNTEHNFGLKLLR